MDLDAKTWLTVAGAFGGSLLGGVLTAFIVERFRKSARSEAYLFDMHKRKIEAYIDISKAIGTLSPESDATALLDAVSRHLPIIDSTVSHWLNLILLGFAEELSFEVFFGYLKKVSPERAQEFAQFKRFWKNKKLQKVVVLSLHTDAINAMRKDLRLAELQEAAELVFEKLKEVERQGAARAAQ